MPAAAVTLDFSHGQLTKSSSQ